MSKKGKNKTKASIKPNRNIYKSIKTMIHYY